MKKSKSLILIIITLTCIFYVPSTFTETKAFWWTSFSSWANNIFTRNASFRKAQTYIRFFLASQYSNKWVKRLTYNYSASNSNNSAAAINRRWSLYQDAENWRLETWVTPCVNYYSPAEQLDTRTYLAYGWVYTNRAIQTSWRFDILDWWIDWATPNATWWPWGTQSDLGSVPWVPNTQLKNVYCNTYDFWFPYSDIFPRPWSVKLWWGWRNSQIAFTARSYDTWSWLWDLPYSWRKHRFTSTHWPSAWTDWDWNCRFNWAWAGTWFWNTEILYTWQREWLVDLNICNLDEAWNINDMQSELWWGWKIDLRAPARPTLLVNGNSHPRDSWVSDPTGIFTIWLNSTGTNWTTGPSPNTSRYCIDTNNSCTPWSWGIARWSFSNPEFNTISRSFGFNLPDWEYYVRSNVQDTWGTSPTDSYRIRIDTTPPVFTVDGVPVPAGPGPHRPIPAGTSDWTNDPSDVTIDLWGISDADSGVQFSKTRWDRNPNMSACVSGTNYWGTNITTTIPSQWTYSHAICIRDNTGNDTEVYSGVYQYDNTVPATPSISSSHTRNAWNTTGTASFNVTNNDLFAYGSNPGGSVGPSPYETRYCIKKWSPCTEAEVNNGTIGTSYSGNLEDGTWYFSARTIETEFGTAHMSPIETYMVQIDTQDPETNANPADRTSWNQAGISLDIDLSTLDPLKDGSNSGLATSRYVVTQDGSIADATNNCTTGTTFWGNITHRDLADGTSWIHVCARDTAGNVTTERWWLYLVDLTDPTITDNYTSDGVWVNTPQTITLTALDAHSWIQQIRYCEGAWCTPTNVIGWDTAWPTLSPITRTLTFTPETDTVVRYITQDWAGNESLIGEIDVKIEDNIPTSPTTWPTYYDGRDNDTIATQRDISYSANDTWGSWLETVTLQRRVAVTDNNGWIGAWWAWQDAQTNVGLTGDTFARVYRQPFENGRAMQYRVLTTDEAGNVWITRASTDTLRMDNVDPTVSDDYASDSVWVNTAQTLNFSLLDNDSGIPNTTAGRRYCLWAIGSNCTPSILLPDFLSFSPDTERQLRYNTTDRAWNTSVPQFWSIDILIEDDRPNASVTYNDEWVNIPVNISFAWDDNNGTIHSNIRTIRLERRDADVISDAGALSGFSSWAPLWLATYNTSSGTPERSTRRVFNTRMYTQLFDNGKAYQYRTYIQDVAGNEKWVYIRPDGTLVEMNTNATPAGSLATLKMENELSTAPTFTNLASPISVNGWTNDTTLWVNVDLSDTGWSWLSSYILEWSVATDNPDYTSLWTSWSTVQSGPISGTTTDINYFFTGQNNHAYNFRIQLVDDAGNITPWIVSTDTPIKVDTILPDAPDITDLSAGSPLLATDNENFSYNVARNGWSPIVYAQWEFEDWNSPNSYLPTDDSRTDLNPAQADEINIDKNIRDVDGDITAGWYREYSYRITSVRDEAGNESAPGIVREFPYRVFANTQTMTNAAAIHVLNGAANLDNTSNIADWALYPLSSELRDMYGNAIVPAGSIGRTINFEILRSNDSSVFLDQYNRSWNQAVFIDTSLPGWFQSIDLASGNPTVFSGLTDEAGQDGEYRFDFKVYAPTATWYAAWEYVSDPNAKFFIEDFSYSVEHATAYAAWDTGVEALDNGQDIDFKFGPLYSADIEGQINDYGMQEWAPQDSNIRITRNSTPAVAITASQLYLEYGAWERLASPYTSLRAESLGANIWEWSWNSSYYGPFNIAGTSNLPLVTTLNMDTATALEESQNTYLSTHIRHNIDGYDVLYNSHVIGKDSYFWAEDGDNTIQGWIKVVGQTHSGNQSDILQDQTQNDIRLLWNLYKASLKKNIIQNAFSIIRNSEPRNVWANPDVSDMTNFSSTANDGEALSKGNVLFFWVDTTYPNRMVEIQWGAISGQKTILAYGRDIYISWNMYYNDKNEDILWIISLKDDAWLGWNIYIHPSVTNVVGTLFAEKSLISYDGTNELWWGTSQTVLRHQLHIYGSVFSENTIGWSRNVTPSCPYYINSGCDRLTAQKYDMNYLRRFFLFENNIWSDVPANNAKVIGWGTCNQNGLCTGNNPNFNRAITDTNTDPYRKNPVVVEYNSWVQTSPPPLFEVTDEQ